MNLLKKKIIFKKNKRKKIIILDDIYLKFNFKHSFEKIDFKELNLYYFFQTIFYYLKSLNKHSLKESYKKVLYDSFYPKIAIGNNVSLKAFECKNLCPYVKVITYQFAWINGYGSSGFYPDSTSIKKYNKTDYFLILHENEKKILKNYYKTKFIKIGSLRNNEIELKKKKNSFLITYISDYSKPPAPVSKKSYCEKFIVRLLNDYCISKNKKLVIALKSNRLDKYIKKNDEIKYYEKLLEKKFTHTKASSYEVINNSQLSISLSSSIGLEMFSRGSKILFLPFLSKYSKKLICQYTPMINNLIFLHSTMEKKKIIKKIDKLLNLKEKEWQRILNKYKLKIMFDKKNTILKNLCDQIIKNET